MSSYEYREGLREPRRRGSRILAFFIGLSLLAAVCAGIFYFLIIQPTMTAISPITRLANALGTVTQQEVKVEGRSVDLVKTEIRELAVAQRQTQSVVKYTTRWLGSQKTIIVRGDFVIKAGFDLGEFHGFELEGDQVVGSWPRAKVLSVDMQKYEIYYEDGGVWNRLSKDDRQEVVNLLVKQARTDAEEKSDLLPEADALIRQRLQDLSGLELKEN